ncbi:hypothetical protein GUJ93_ZPchr0012g22188 [Zizania palustris]|uniref:Scarecrow-like protein 6 n=1 Tax=Zizania palustris TaxID=103762 RepID=A0A8J6BW66_ZIZPA|nr:hypothetical protein GUJ93_ZPchr0012g22188 [Zizania palustris]
MAGAPAPKLPPFPSPLGPAGGFVPALKPKAEAANDEAAAAVDQLAEAAKLAEAVDAFGAREILARLNYRLPAAPTARMPLLRSAFYFKEALRLALSPTGESPAPSASMPYDMVLMLGAYKAFSERRGLHPRSRLRHRHGRAVGVADSRARSAPARDGAQGHTALVSPASHHPLELQLINENLSSFTNELDVFFQFSVYNIDTLDPADLLAIASGDAVAVYLPVGSAHGAEMPAVLLVLKRLGAKAFQSCVFLLESVDAVGTDADTVAKIERFLIPPSVEQSVLGRHRAAMDKALPWRTVFTSSGFMPVPPSAFAESQAASLLEKVHVRGFQVEKCTGSLCLYWQRGELVSVSVWRC